MAEHRGCTSCKGSGKLIGLGNLKVNCGSCQGIGWTNVLSEVDEDALLNPVESSVPAFGVIKRKRELRAVKHGENQSA